MGTFVLARRRKASETNPAVALLCPPMQIELKLKKLGEEWASEVFTFAEHKNRGPVILKVRLRRDGVDLCCCGDSGHRLNLAGGRLCSTVEAHW